MSVNVKWFGHASFRIASGDTVIYIDPWKLKVEPHDATAVLVSHGHYDHYSAEDIEKVSTDSTQLIATQDVIDKHGDGTSIAPRDKIELDGVIIVGVASYNPAKPFHPKENKWVGFVVTIGSKRVYYAGDSDVTPEMKSLKEIDLALMPVGGKFTMSADDAASAVNTFKPKAAVPYHYGDIVGKIADAQTFATKAECQVQILAPGTALDI